MFLYRYEYEYNIYVRSRLHTHYTVCMRSRADLQLLTGNKTDDSELVADRMLLCMQQAGCICM